MAKITELPTEEQKEALIAFRKAFNNGVADDKRTIEKVRKDTDEALGPMAPELKDFVLSHSTDPYEVDVGGGNSPLHEAAKLGDTELTKILVKHGANLDDTNDAGEKPKDVAINGWYGAYQARTYLMNDAAVDSRAAKESRAAEHSSSIVDPAVIGTAHDSSDSAILENTTKVDPTVIGTVQVSDVDEKDIIVPPTTTAFAGGVGNSGDVDEEEKKKKKAELVTYSSYESIREDLDFSKSPLAEIKISATQKRFGDVADGGTVLETYDKKKGFQYKIEPKDTDSPSKVYKIEVPRMGDDGKIIPNEVDTLVFNRNGQLLEYKEPQQAKGECRLDQEWLSRLIAERETALAREQSGVQISSDVGGPQVGSGATVGEVDSADRSSISANVENQLLGGGATVAKVGSNPTVSSSISADVVEPQGRSGANVEVNRSLTVSATKIKAPAKPLSEREIFKREMQKAQREQDTALLKRANAADVQKVEGEQEARDNMVDSIKKRNAPLKMQTAYRRYKAMKAFREKATVVKGGNTHTPDPSPKVVTNTDKVQVRE